MKGVFRVGTVVELAQMSTGCDAVNNMMQAGVSFWRSPAADSPKVARPLSADSVALPQHPGCGPNPLATA
jgi:hypothetical protein